MIQNIYLNLTKILIYKTNLSFRLTMDKPNVNLEFSFVTGSEKLDIMISSPVKKEVEKVGNHIIKKRQMDDKVAKELFLREIKMLILGRSGGIPKILPKPK